MTLPEIPINTFLRSALMDPEQAATKMFVEQPAIQRFIHEAMSRIDAVQVVAMLTGMSVLYWAIRLVEEPPENKMQVTEWIN
jgi:hypothetical protein